MGWLADLWRYGLAPRQRALSRSAERYAADITAYEKALTGLSHADARAAAQRVLATSGVVRAIPWDAPPVDHPALAAGQREFFREVRRVEADSGEPYVDAAELAPYEWNDTYLRFGQDSEHAHVVVRPGEEMVYVISDDEPPEQPPGQSFRSIYHWVLWLHRSAELLAEPEPPVE